MFSLNFSFFGAAIQLSILDAMSIHDWQQCWTVIECGRDNKRGLLIATYISLLQYIPPIYLQFISIYIYLPPPPTYIFNLSPIYINIYIYSSSNIYLQYISNINIFLLNYTLFTFLKQHSGEKQICRGFDRE